MRLIVNATIFTLLIVMQVLYVSAAPKEKVVGTFTVKGYYLGWIDAEIDGGDWHMVKIEVDGKDQWYISSKEDADKYLGTDIGNVVEATITKKIIPDGGTDPLEFLTDGKVLGTSMERLKKALTSEKWKSFEFSYCRGKGDDISKCVDEQGDLVVNNEFRMVLNCSTEQPGTGTITGPFLKGSSFDSVPVTWLIEDKTMTVKTETGQTMTFTAVSTSVVMVDRPGFVFIVSDGVRADGKNYAAIDEEKRQRKFKREEVAGDDLKSKCPQKVLSAAHLTEGEYVGVVRRGWVDIKLQNGNTFSFLMDEKKADMIFGQPTGQKVSVLTKKIQQWIQDENKEGGSCLKAEVFVAGQVDKSTQREEIARQNDFSGEKTNSLEHTTTMQEKLNALKNDLISKKILPENIPATLMNFEGKLSEVKKEDLEKTRLLISEIYSIANSLKNEKILDTLKIKYDELKEKHERKDLNLYKEFVHESHRTTISNVCGFIENEIQKQCLKRGEADRESINRMRKDALSMHKKICKKESLKLCDQLINGFPDKYKDDIINLHSGMTIYEFACSAAKAGAYKYFSSGSLFSNRISLTFANSVVFFFERVRLDKEKLQEVSSSTDGPNIINFLKTTEVKYADGRSVKQNYGYDPFLNPDYGNEFGGVPHIHECSPGTW